MAAASEKLSSLNSDKSENSSLNSDISKSSSQNVQPTDIGEPWPHLLLSRPYKTARKLPQGKMSVLRFGY